MLSGRGTVNGTVTTDTPTSSPIPVTPPVIIPPSGGGSTPTVDVNNVTVTNATSVTFSSNASPTSLTWNGEVATLASYDASTKLAIITVPSITKTANILVVNADNYSPATLNYTIPAGTYGALKVMGSSAELIAAIKAQADGQTWVIKEGLYDVLNDATTLRGDNGEVVTSGGQSGWYMPIKASNLTIIGENNPILTSTTKSENGAWASQNWVCK